MWIIKLGIVFSILSIAIGAFGAHALTNIIADKIGVFKTAVQYQIFHALGLILIGIISKIFSVDLNIVAYLIISGIILFSGSLYIISIYKISLLGMITPIGGALFIIGWSVLLFKINNL
ncbi:MAG: DUF423 domain-containing protein [Flavobacteriales bacterium]|tara:strand:+ start:1300 stop:1656 length:357 start_codon:yes stop_codon:yes gene_type:complete